MPAVEHKLHSLLKTCSVLISSLDPCFPLIYKVIPTSSSLTPGPKLRWERATRREMHNNVMVTEELTRKVILSVLEPVLREDTNRFLRLRRADF